MSRGRDKITPPPLPVDLLGQNLGPSRPAAEKKKKQLTPMPLEDSESSFADDEKPAYFDSPVTELRYVTERLRLAEDNLEQERQMRLIAEESLHGLVSSEQLSLLEPDLKMSISPTKGSPTKKSPARHGRDEQMMSPRMTEAMLSSEGRAREEKWATIARMNKRKVVELETQARGDERRILRLERALETERTARVELEDGLAEILAHGEDMLEMMKRTSSFSGSHCEELKKTYGQARGILRSPNKNTTEKSVTLSGAVRKLYNQVMQETEARTNVLETALVAEQRRSKQLEEALQSKLCDLEKARLLFRQIVRLLPSQSREKIGRHLDISPQASQAGGKSPGQSSYPGLTAEEAFLVGEANNFTAKPSVALTFSNDQFNIYAGSNGSADKVELIETGQGDGDEENLTGINPIEYPVRHDFEALEREALERGSIQHHIEVNRLPPASPTFFLQKEYAYPAEAPAEQRRFTKEMQRDSFLEQITAAISELSPDTPDKEQKQRGAERELVQERSTEISGTAQEELTRNSPTLAEAQAKAKLMMDSDGPAISKSTTEEKSTASKWDAISHSAELLPRLVPDRDAMKERMRLKFEEKLRDAGVDISI